MTIRIDKSCCTAHKPKCKHTPFGLEPVGEKIDTAWRKDRNNSYTSTIRLIRWRLSTHVVILKTKAHLRNLKMLATEAKRSYGSPWCSQLLWVVMRRRPLQFNTRIYNPELSNASTTNHLSPILSRAGHLLAMCVWVLAGVFNRHI